MMNEEESFSLSDSSEYSSSSSSGGCLEILRDGNPIWGANANVLPGEMIKLSISCFEDYEDIAVVAWTIPGTIFYSFTPGNTASDLETGYSTEDDSNSEIQFCWANSGESVTITARIFIVGGGEIASPEATFNIITPSCTFAAVVQGTVILDPADAPNVVSFGKEGPPGGTNAIRFEGNVTLPDGFSQGQWAFLQTGQISNMWTLEDSDECFENPVFWANVVLDTSFPYPGSDPAGDGHNHNTGSGSHNAVDLPAVPIRYTPSIATDQVTVDEDFQMYIMFFAKWRPESMGSASGDRLGLE